MPGPPARAALGRSPLFRRHRFWLPAAFGLPQALWPSAAEAYTVPNAATIAQLAADAGMKAS